MAARKFQPGQFYRLQNFETFAPVIDLGREGDDGRAPMHAQVRLAMEGLALTGAWVDNEKGLLGTIVLEMGGSSRLCAALEPGEPIVLMGPTGQPDRDREAGDGAALRRGPRQRGPLLDRARLQGARRQGALLRRLPPRGGPLQARRHRALDRPDHLVHRHRRAHRAAPPAGRAFPRQHRAGDARVRQRGSSAGRRRSRSARSSASSPSAATG